MESVEIVENFVNKRTDKVKEIIIENFMAAKGGVFFTRNMVGDHMTNIYEDAGIKIDICYGSGYFEVFGLTPYEEMVVENFHNELWRAMQKSLFEFFR